MIKRILEIEKFKIVKNQIENEEYEERQKNEK